VALPRAPGGWLPALYRRERRPLFAFFWARLGEREEALDLVQEVFARACRHAAGLHRLPASRRRAWLFACARRLTVDRYRRRAVARRAVPIPPPPGDGPEAAVERADVLRRLDCAIRLLPDPEREALALVVLGGLTSADAARVLGLPAGTVRYHLFQARRRLKAVLGQEDGGGARRGGGG
jgi:RNA polymerase sigma-70 factor (ECF subfamily)